jgi:hypothetical protein
VEKADYISNPRNDKRLKQMVRTGNEWCRRKMTVTQFTVDMLWILLDYLELLHAGGRSWEMSHQEEMFDACVSHDLMAVVDK